MRFPSIDLLRAVAIALMVTVHFVENLSGAWGEGVDFNRVGWLPAGFAAPLFTFLSGVSYSIWSDGLTRGGVSDAEIAKRTVRRGLFLFGLGIAFNVLVWLPEETFNWDILTFIGSSLLVLAACRTMPPAIPPLIALLAVAIAPVLRALAGYADFWRLGSYEPDLTLADVWLGFLCTGYFPLFPWLAFPIAGYAVAPAIFSTGHGGASLWPAAISASRRCGLVFGMGACLRSRDAGHRPDGCHPDPSLARFPGAPSDRLATCRGRVAQPPLSFHLPFAPRPAYLAAVDRWNLARRRADGVLAAVPPPGGVAGIGAGVCHCLRPLVCRAGTSRLPRHRGADALALRLIPPTMLPTPIFPRKNRIGGPGPVSVAWGRRQSVSQHRNLQA